MKTKIFLLISVGLILIALAYFEKNNLPNGLVTPSNYINRNNITKDKISNFEFEDINRNTTNNIYNLKSDKIIIHFWAAWCNVCTTEFNDLIKFAQKNPHIYILLISIDDDKVKLINFIKNLKSIRNLNKMDNLIFIWDKDKFVSSSLFNSYMVPENYILNKNFEVTKKLVGKIDWSNI